MQRDYLAIARRLVAAPDRDTRIRSVIDALWDGLSTFGVSWVGFYVRESEDALVLAYCRDKPACSPIGLHGACGRALLERRALVVTDVANLGEGYIACDPRDRAEVVLPLLDDEGAAWGVLDVDSFDTHAFGVADVDGLRGVLIAAGLRTDNGPPIVV